MGKFVRFSGAAMDPQGALLSAAADQTLSEGHMKAAGPISSYSAAEATAAVKAKLASRDLGDMLQEMEFCTTKNTKGYQK